MEQKKFEAMLVLVIPQVIGLVVENNGVDEVTATREFYSSEVYALLEQEETKIWQLSPLTIFNMYEQERKTGSITFPEG